MCVIAIISCYFPYCATNHMSITDKEKQYEPGCNDGSTLQSKLDELMHVASFNAAVHNLFRPRTSNRFLNPFGGQTSVTIIAYVNWMNVKMYEDDDVHCN